MRAALRGMIPALLLAASAAQGEPPGPRNVLLVVNTKDPVSVRIGEYYVHKRGVPLSNVCRIQAVTQEEITWPVYESQVERPVAQCLQQKGLADRVLYIVTTRGVPLKVKGAKGGQESDSAAVDSELTLLYAKMKGVKFNRAGRVPNPFFRMRDEPFHHPPFAIYLVTRLAAYDFDGVKAMIDRSMAAANRGSFVIDLKSSDDRTGNDWLRTAAMLLPAARVVLDESSKVLYGQTGVIGYASWGSNDGNRKRRSSGFRWLPGAVATAFVSTDGRTFERPPEKWNITTWRDEKNFFGGSPQTLTADLIQEGATGASGHVYEPYLAATPRPELLLPAYYNGRNLAESFYLSIPFLSWQTIVVGDPLCSLGKPTK